MKQSPVLGIINQCCHPYKAQNFILYFHFNRGPAAKEALRNAKAGETRREERKWAWPPSQRCFPEPPADFPGWPTVANRWEVRLQTFLQGPTREGKSLIFLRHELWWRTECDSPFTVTWKLGIIATQSLKACREGSWSSRCLSSWDPSRPQQTEVLGDHGESCELWAGTPYTFPVSLSELAGLPPASWSELTS